MNNSALLDLWRKVSKYYNVTFQSYKLNRADYNHIKAIFIFSYIAYTDMQITQSDIAAFCEKKSCTVSSRIKKVSENFDNLYNEYLFVRNKLDKTQSDIELLVKDLYDNDCFKNDKKDLVKYIIKKYLK